MKTPITYRKYLSIDDIHKEYLPISKKKLRLIAKKYLPYKTIGGRMYVERAALEDLLNNPTISTLSVS